tara:strand:- start:86924 stop:87124 length:201 start_codon:yes stop_codon:yes gene_type:complete
MKLETNKKNKLLININAKKEISLLRAKSDEVDKDLKKKAISLRPSRSMTGMRSLKKSALGLRPTTK